MKIKLDSNDKAFLKTLYLTGTNSKESALEILIKEASRHTDNLSFAEIQRLVQEREQIATTLVSDNIAFPHAVKQDINESVIILGISRSPILWSQPDQHVQLIVLFAGGTRHHLESMSFAAKILRQPDALNEILEAENEFEVEKIFRKNIQADTYSSNTNSVDKYNSIFLHTAKRLRKELKKSDLAVIDAVFSSNHIAESWYREFDGWVLTTKDCCLSGKKIKKEKAITILNPEIIFTENEIKRLSIEGFFTDIDSLIILHGDQGNNCVSSLKIVNLRNKDEIRFIEDIPYNVSQRVLQLAREIGAEGREGKPVGCMFIVGSEEILNEYTHQLIVNPFAGYPEEARNIIDPSLEETIKEFSKIDGAFIIKPDGTIKSAGTYIAISPHKLEHHPGEGARHASARGITAVAKCLAIAVSESTGRVSVYADGRRIL